MKIDFAEKLSRIGNKIIMAELVVFLIFFLVLGLFFIAGYSFIGHINPASALHKFQGLLGTSLFITGIVAAVIYWFAAFAIIGFTSMIFDFFKNPLSAVLTPPEQKIVEFMIKERESISDMVKRDISFSKLQFLDMTSLTFFKIHEALVNREIDVVSAFISPEVYQRLYSRTEQLISSQQLFRIENLKVKNAEIHHYYHTDDEGGMDHIIAKLQASAVYNIVNEQDGTVVRGAAQTRDFTEYFIFFRSDKTVTPYRNTEYVSRHCQNCGAPLDLEKLGDCSFCGSKASGSTSASIDGSRSWSLLRPGQVKKSGSIFKENCPNCGAGLPSGNIKKCEHCGSVLVSGKFTWVLENIMDRCFIIPEQPFRPSYDFDFYPVNTGK